MKSVHQSTVFFGLILAVGCLAPKSDPKTSSLQKQGRATLESEPSALSTSKEKLTEEKTALAKQVTSAVQEEVESAALQSARAQFLTLRLSDVERYLEEIAPLLIAKPVPEADLSVSMTTQVPPADSANSRELGRGRRIWGNRKRVCGQPPSNQRHTRRNRLRHATLSCEEDCP